MRRSTALLPLALYLSGCATFIHSELDDGSKPGLRYSLPVTFLLVTPKPDGTLQNDILYLPDPDNTYVLRTKSLISSYTLDVQLDHQMLKSVSLSSKSDAVAAVLAESASNVAKARIEADAKADLAAKTADAEAAKALAEADLAVQVGQAKLDALTVANVSSDLILAAQIDVDQAKVKKKALEKSRDRASGNLASANAPGAAGQPNSRMAAGPMLFRIVPDGKGVKLVAVKGPNQFATGFVAAALNPVTMTPNGTIPVQPDAATHKTVLEVSINRTISAVNMAQVFKKIDPNTVLPGIDPAIKLAPDANGTKLSIEIPSVLAAGDYLIVLDLSPRTGERFPAQIYFQLTK